MSSKANTTGPVSIVGRWRELQPFLGVSTASILLLVVAAVLAGFAEATVLALVVQAASVLQAGTDASVHIGPLALAGMGIGTLLIVAFAAGIARLLLQLVNAYVPARLAADVQHRLRTRVFGSFAAAPWSVQAQERDGHLQEIVTTQVNRSTSMVTTLGTGLAAGFNFLALIASAFLLNVVAATLVICAAVVLFFALRPLSRLARRASRTLSAVNLNFAHGVTEAVRLAEEAQVFGVQHAQAERIGELSGQVRVPYFRSQLLSGLVAPLYQGVTILLLVVALALLKVAGTTNLVSLGAVVLILLRAMSYSQTVQSAYHSVNDLTPFVERVRDTLERYDEAVVPDGPRPLDAVERIDFRNVSFSYAPGRKVLHSVSLDVLQGESVGILGPSGAGKSTFVQLLLGLRSPQEGQVRVNGRPICEYRRRDWFRRIAYVPQDSRLVDGTVADNIRFHRPWVDDDDVERAARLAGIHDDIVGWQDGYATAVGQRADAVSGGQRQRLCLARALAGQPDLLVLDEPTSALDVPSENLVQQSLEELRGKLTLFIVAHRLSTLNICDRLIVFEEGRLSASGSHTDLSAMGGFYQHAVALTRTSPTETLA